MVGDEPNGRGVLPLGSLRGTNVEGTIQLSEATVNDLLRLGSHQNRVPIIEVQANNQLTVRYGLLHARLTLPDAVDLGTSPRVTISLASVIVAWGLKAVVHQPYVHIHGRHVTIDVAAVPALDPWRTVWPHFRSVQLSTDQAVLRVRFAFSIGTVSVGSVTRSSLDS